MGEERISSGMLSNNNNFVTSEVIGIRLDTRSLLQDIEVFLKGQKIIPVPNRERGTVDYELVQVGRPMMNDLGIQSILNSLTMVINPHVSQGNVTRDDYNRLIEELDQNLSVSVANNLERWEVDILDYDVVLDAILTSLQFFLSQPINAGTRDSLTHSVRVSESNTQTERGFKMPFTGG